MPLQRGEEKRAPCASLWASSSFLLSSLSEITRPREVPLLLLLLEVTRPREPPPFSPPFFPR